jgi:asparagine synthase (glutamine-hydrolysing)
MLLYFDKMSMAASLEVRVPFADHDLVSFSMGLGDNRRIRHRRGKELLRQVSRGLVDEAIIERPKRGFFRSASGAWLTHNRQLVRETLLDERCARRGIFSPAALRTLLDEAPRQGRAGEPLLLALMLELWHRVFVDSDGPASRSAREATHLTRPS